MVPNTFVRDAMVLLLRSAFPRNCGKQRRQRSNHNLALPYKKYHSPMNGVTMISRLSRDNCRASSRDVTFLLFLSEERAWFDEWIAQILRSRY